MNKAHEVMRGAYKTPDASERPPLTHAIASALAEERKRTWDRAIEIAGSTWATTTMGAVKIEHQAEYERLAIVEALRVAKEGEQ